MPRAMTYRYPWRAMLPDYARACFGLGCTLIPLFFMDASRVVAVVLVFLGLIFTLFAMQALLRQATRIAVNEREIRARPLGPRLAWGALSGVKLTYFSVRRDGGGGWMELKLQSGGRSLRIDSRLEGFTEVVRQAAAAATDACLHLDNATISNLATLSVNFQGTHARASSRLREQD